MDFVKFDRNSSACGLTVMIDPQIYLPAVYSRLLFLPLNHDLLTIYKKENFSYNILLNFPTHANGVIV